MDENKRLQESRKKSIPELVGKYQKLVDEIFTAVTKELPSFKDIIKEDEEVVALDNANPNR